MFSQDYCELSLNIVQFVKHANEGSLMSINQREWVVKNSISAGIMEELQNIKMGLYHSLEEFVRMGKILLKKTEV